MDLSKFKVLSEDDSHYEVGHPSGKKLRVEKSKLSNNAHETIKKLCAGGVARYSGEDAAPEDQIVEQPQQQAIEGVPGALAPTVPQPYEVPPVNIPQQTLPAQPSVPVTGGDVNTSTPVPTGTPQDINSIIQDKSMTVRSALGEQKTGVQAEAKALGNQGYQEAKAIQNTSDQISQMETQQQIMDKYKQKDQALMNAFNSKTIDPNRLFETTGSKITAGIALFLGGLGASLTHGSNQAADMIKGLVDRDIDAQKSDQSKAMNAWKMNREMMGSDLGANLATQNQMYTALKYKLTQAASQAQGPLAIARAQQGTAAIDQKLGENNQMLSMLKMGSGLGEEPGTGAKGKDGFVGKDPSMLVPALVKDPGSQKQVFEEIRRAQIVKKEGSNILKAFDEAVNEQKLFSKNAIPWVNSAARGKLMTLLGPTFQQIDGTVNHQLMEQVETSVLPSIMSTKDTDAHKRESLIQYLQSAASAPTALGHGIDLQRFQSTSMPEFSDNHLVQTFMRENPQVKNEAQAIQILKAHGKVK